MPRRPPERWSSWMRPAAPGCGAWSTPLPAPPMAISPPAASASPMRSPRCRLMRPPSWPAELYCQAFTATYGLETVALRYFNIFGPRQDPASPYSAVIPLFITTMFAGRQPVVYGDGRQSRDFCYVGNAVAANLLAADAPAVAGRVLNVANGKSIDLLTLIDVLNRLLGTHLTPSTSRRARRRPREPGRHHLGADPLRL